MRRKKLRKARESKGLAAIHLGDRLGICEDRVYSIERGRYRPKREEALRWAAELDLEPATAFPELFAQEVDV